MIINRPVDFHVHLRSGEMLRTVLPYTERAFQAAVIMPNVPAINTFVDLVNYAKEITSAIKTDFRPLMTFKISPESDVANLKRFGAVAGKLYPNNVTTGSENGVSDIKSLYDVFDQMQTEDLVLCIHAEEPRSFCLDRERDYLNNVAKIINDFPTLRIVIEHLSSAFGIEFVKAAPHRVSATITVHHLMLTLDDVIGGGNVGSEYKLHPHLYCAPIAKQPHDCEALIKAAISGDRKFFLGTDSAPHLKENKECEFGCAGVFVSHPIEILASIFDQNNAISRLENYTSNFGAWFYNYQLNDEGIELVKEITEIPTIIDNKIVPFLSGRMVNYSIRN